MNLLNLFDILDTVSAEKKAETPAGIPPAVQVSQADGQPATIVVPVATTDEVEVLEDEHEDSLELGDEVIITGNVQFRGKTGRIVDFGANKHFVVVDLYNFGKHSFHSSNVAPNDYADSEEEDADWRERDEVDEGAEFGAYYYEQLAQKVFDENPNLSTKGRADDLFKAGWKYAVQDLGKKRAQWEFGYDEDFPSDFVSAYAYLQGGGELEEGWKQNLAALGTAAALGATGMAAMGGNTPTTGGPQLANPTQVVQMIKSGKIADSQDLQAALANAKNKNQVWSMLQNAAGMQGSSDADAVIQTIAGVREGVSEDLGTMAGAAALGSLAAGAIGAGMGHWLKKDREKERAKMDAIVNPKKKKDVAEGSLGKKSSSKPTSQIEKAFNLGKFHNQTGFTGTNPFKDHPVDVQRAYKQGKQGVAEEVDTGEYDARKTTPSNDDSQFWDRQTKLRKARNKAAQMLGYEDMWDMPNETTEWKDLVNKLMSGDLEEGLGKKIKRGLQGWYKDDIGPNGENLGDPKELVRRNKSYDDETLQRFAKSIAGEKKTKHSPGELQQRVIDREMRKRGLGEQGVAEGEYDDPRWEPREPDMSRKVDWDIEAQRNAPDKQEPAKTVTVTDNNGKVVLTFPSTGGFYGDLRYATSKGFDTDSGDYHLSWKRDTNEGNNWLDTPVSEEFDRIKKLAGLK